MRLCQASHGAWLWISGSVSNVSKRYSYLTVPEHLVRVPQPHSSTQAPPLYQHPLMPSRCELNEVPRAEKNRLDLKTQHIRSSKDTEPYLNETKRLQPKTTQTKTEGTMQARAPASLPLGGPSPWPEQVGAPYGTAGTNAVSWPQQSCGTVFCSVMCGIEVSEVLFGLLPDGSV